MMTDIYILLDQSGRELGFYSSNANAVAQAPATDTYQVKRVTLDTLPQPLVVSTSVNPQASDPNQAEALGH